MGKGDNRRTPKVKRKRGQEKKKMRLARRAEIKKSEKSSSGSKAKAAS